MGHIESAVEAMAKKAAPVEGVYERAVGSGLWYARYRKDGKKVRNHSAAVGLQPSRIWRRYALSS